MQYFINQVWTDGEEYTFTVGDIKDTKIGDEIRLKTVINDKGTTYIYCTFLSYNAERQQLRVLVERTV